MTDSTTDAITEAQTAAAREYLAGLQKRLGAAFADVEGCAFDSEQWQSKLGAGVGLHCQDGSVFERAGINFSDIAGRQLPPAASVRRPQLAGQPYVAAGVSVVAHPLNPYCPTAHLNVRFFAAQDAWWFGGGMDLTPYYGFEEDCRHFHGVCKSTLDSIDPTLYPQFKKKCDEYFYIRHRNEARGIGGIFFDDFHAGGFDQAFQLARKVGDAFADAYLPLVNKHKEDAYGHKQINWQQQRRGRYVEFNLVYDRGTLFGLQSGGRAASILMSLPPKVQWRELPPPGTEEEKLLTDFLPPREWV